MSDLFSAPLTPRPAPGLPQERVGVFGSPRQGPSRYVNPWAPMTPPKPMDMLKWKTSPNPWAHAKRSPTAPRQAPDALPGFKDLALPLKVLWNGHATTLVELDGLRVLIDPVFGPAAVVPRKRPSPLSVQALPRIHAVLLTHGHYDHFEAKTLKQLAERFGPDLWFVVPEGLGRYLPTPGARVVELSWWEQVTLMGVTLTLTPAQHWHRRGARDYNAALWGGWYLSGSQRLYHPGDSGYFEGFEAVRQLLGEPDVTLLPLGAFEPRWFMRYQHMAPQEALQLWKQLRSRHVVAMHWGVFDLSDEPLDHGPELMARMLVEQDERALLAGFHALSLGATLGVSAQDWGEHGGQLDAAAIGS